MLPLKGSDFDLSDNLVIQAVRTLKEESSMDSLGPPLRVSQDEIFVKGSQTRKTDLGCRGSELKGTMRDWSRAVLIEF